MQANALFSVLGHLDNKITDIYQIAQFTDRPGNERSFVEALRFPVQYFKPDKSSVKTEVRPHYPYIVAHDGLYFPHALGYKNHLLEMGRTLVIPVGKLLLKTQIV